ncbi:hypothetical protein PT277_05425 [Acetobacteraceae bacterium ESL0709]|nr:hypothetical protein [Acetobacteraceae bacterium ESL0697]MDF7678137.1 hypothetical protein [Acetobacteraceae bacterium ESL0709]
MRLFWSIVASAVFTAIIPSSSHADDVTLEAPFFPLPAASTGMPPSIQQKKRHTHYSHEQYARRLKDEKRLEDKGLSPDIARKAVWAIAHKPQSSCAVYAMHLAGYHDMKFVRPDLTGRSDQDTDTQLVSLITKQELCDKSHLDKRLPSAPPYVPSHPVSSLFQTQPQRAKSILIAAGISSQNADDAAWAVLHHPDSPCAWHVERILADERSGDRNSDDEKDAVMKIEHRNECSRVYYKK